MRPAHSEIDARAMTIWLLLSIGFIQLASDPFASVLAIAGAWLVSSLAQDRKTFRSFVVLGIGITILRTMLFAVVGHSGQHTLFALPSVALPHFLGGLRLGGPVKAEAILIGLEEGATLIAMLTSFGAFLSVVGTGRMLRGLSRFAFDAGLILNIAATFGTTMAQSVRDIRDSQLMRGQSRLHLKGTLVPLVGTAIDRSIALAESMDGRGFGHRASPSKTNTQSIVTIISGMAAASCGSLMAMGVAPLLTSLGFASSAAALVLSLRKGSGDSILRRALQTKLGRRERLALGLLGAYAMALISTRLTGNLGPGFDPYTSWRLAAPTTATSLLGAGLALPILVLKADLGKARMLRGNGK